ncbi:probable serine/threonine-protein kinase samkC [Drosophila kikkawai]|uniref:Probable serine/threonine-protein kinase samkC n=1 Tax=Drosophila kikkawai TaxID=30033 RepID=A0A6P4JK12_DROKI|nr:proteoglycan 4 [Drosophila kikkawai]KAH8315018.1 hypothetical protein KR059_002043 [Drosophila kikkawai]
MPNLQNTALAQLQGVPVETQRNESHLTNSSAESRLSFLKRFFKIGKKPLMLPYKKKGSAVSFDGENEANTLPNIFSRKKAPAPLTDRTLSFINNRDQSTSMANPVPQNMPLRITKTKMSFWKRLFPRQKSQPNDETPNKETCAGNEPEELQQVQIDPENQSAKDLEEPPLGESQEQNLPEPERVTANTSMKSGYLSFGAKPEDPEPNPQTSEEVNLPIDLKPERLKPKTPMKSAYLSFATEPEDSEPSQPATDEVILPIDTEPDRSKPKTPKKKNARDMSEEQILSTYKRDIHPAAAEPQDATPNQPVSDKIDP